MNAPARPVLLRLAGVTKRFWLGKTEVIALRDVDLQVRAGEMLAVWGPSGSGKSTLMNLAGLVDAPSEGQVFFEGEAVQYQNERLLAERRNRRIGFVFQTFNLVPVLSVLENVQLPLQIRGVRRAVLAVEVGGGFVGNDEGRFAHQGARNGHPLTLSLIHI